MIPFQIFGVKAYYIKKEIEIRALELFPDGFSFRLSINFFDKKECDLTICSPEKIEVYGYSWKRQTYKRIELSTSDYKVMSTDKNDYYYSFRLFSKDSEFMKLIKEVSNDYLEYIDVKLNLDDDEMAHVMTDYPLHQDDIFFEDMDSQLKAWGNRIKAKYKENTFQWVDGRRSDFEIYISLDNPNKADNYLCKPLSDFVEDYFCEMGLQSHPLKEAGIDGLYIGNEYCDELIFKEDLLRSIIEKAQGEGLKVCLVKPVICEQKSSYINLLCKLAEEYTGLEIKDSVLLCKQTRDPRSKYVMKSDTSCIQRTETEVYVPFFQTNTGTFCPLYAVIHNGKRERQEQVTNCPQYCKTACFMYPKHLDMIGRYNSLFGFNQELLTDGKILERLINQGINRVIINL